MRAALVATTMLSFDMLQPNTCTTLSTSLNASECGFAAGIV